MPNTSGPSTETETVGDPTVSSGSEDPPVARPARLSDADLKQLAEKLYRLLKQELRIERERRGRV